MYNSFVVVTSHHIESIDASNAYFKRLFSSISHISDSCCKCFFLDVAKVYIDVACVCWLYTHVSSVYFKCFICFRRMLQVFYLDVTKVDLNVAKVDLYVAYTCMLQVYVSSILGVSYVCCKRFIWILHMFCNGYSATHVFSWCFRRILKVFQLFRTYVVSISSRC